MSILAQPRTRVNRTAQGIAAHRAYLHTCPRYVATLEELETTRSKITSVRAFRRACSSSSRFELCQKHSASLELKALEDQLAILEYQLRILDGRVEGLEELDESTPF